MSLSPPGVRLFYDPRGHHAGAINELCWGLEEQGVPCQTITYDGGGDAAALGALAAMHLCRHKIRTPRFAWGVPVLLAVQCALLAWGSAMG